MLDADSFNHVLDIVRVCLAANRADLIEPALLERRSVSEVRATISAAAPAAPQPVKVTFTKPTPAEAAALGVAIANRVRAVHGEAAESRRDPLAAAIEKRLRAMYPATPPAAGRS